MKKKIFSRSLQIFFSTRGNFSKKMIICDLLYILRLGVGLLYSRPVLNCGLNTWFTNWKKGVQGGPTKTKEACIILKWYDWCWNEMRKTSSLLEVFFFIYAQCTGSASSTAPSRFLPAGLISLMKAYRLLELDVAVRWTNPRGVPCEHWVTT